MAYKRFSPIPVVEGGTSLLTITAHNIIIGNGTGTPALVAPSSTAGVALVSAGASANPAYGTVVVAGGGTGLTTLTAHYTVVGNGTSNVSLIAPSATAGIPYVSGGSAADPSFTTAVVAGGGTGIVTTTAYAPILAGTTATGAFQQATTNFSTSGFVLTSTGSSSVPTWQAVPSGSVISVTTVNNAASPYTVLTSDNFLAVDSSGGVVSLLLPDAPSTGRVFYIKDSTGSAATNNITVTTVSGTDLIDGATSYVLNTAYQSINVIFDGAAYEIF